MDDFLTLSNNLSILYNFRIKLSESFYIVDLRLVSHYLGIAITWTEKSRSLDQISYLKKIF